MKRIVGIVRISLLVVALGLAIVVPVRSSSQGVGADDYELDNALGLAHEIAPGGDIQSRTIFPEYDVDWVFFAAQAGHSYRVDVLSDGGAAIAMKLALYNAAGAQLAAEGFGRSMDYPLLFVESPIDGRIYIRASSSRFGTGNYALRVVEADPARILGAVTDGEAPLPGVNVKLWWQGDSSERLNRTVYTDAAGRFEWPNLADSVYRLSFVAPSGVSLDGIYDDAPDLSHATPITVTPGSTVSVAPVLARGGQISGRVTGPDGITAAQGIAVFLQQYPTWQTAAWGGSVSTTTDADGEYRIAGLPTNDYALRFSDPAGRYLMEYYADAPDIEHSTRISVTIGQAVSGINATLATADVGGVRGRVTGADGGAPIVRATIAFDRRQESGGWGTWVQSYPTDANGDYVAYLEPGVYRARISDYYGGEYLPQYYDNVLSAEAATSITVTTGQTVNGIDAVLAMGGYITGVVTGPDGVVPLADISVIPCRLDPITGSWTCLKGVRTDARGAYRVKGLETGVYRLGFWAPYRPVRYYVTEYYQDAESLDGATDIPITAGATTGNIDVALAEYGHIAGRVTDPDGVTPVLGAAFTIYRKTATGVEFVVGGVSDAMGFYDMGGLDTGTYRICFKDWSYRHADGCYEHAPDIEHATDLAVTRGLTTTVNMVLDRAGLMVGRVTGTDGVTPLAGVQVTAHNRLANGSWSTAHTAGSALTDADGRYRIEPLQPDTYRVYVSDLTGHFLSEYYDNAADLFSATDIIVHVNDVVTGIDASLLEGGRIEGTVRAPDGITPVGGVQVLAIALSNTVAYAPYPSRSALTNDTGFYSVDGVASTNYRMDFTHTTGLFPPASYPEPVLAMVGQTVSGIDVQLQPWGRILGTVTGPDGVTGLAGIRVTVYAVTEPPYFYPLRDVITDDEGNYDTGSLYSSAFRIGFSDPENRYASEFYQDTPDLENATDIAVRVGAPTLGIDASLSVWGRISGMVVGPDGIAPLSGVRVTASTEPFSWWRPVSTAKTDANGLYDLSLRRGIYRIQFRHEELGFPEVYYRQVSDLAYAVSITVTDGLTVTGINAQLGPAGSITGTVFEADGVTPLPNIYVSLYYLRGDDWSEHQSVYTYGLGHYSFDYLTTNIYRIGFSDPSLNYRREYYRDAEDLQHASDILVSPGVVTGGINVSLDETWRVWLPLVWR